MRGKTIAFAVIGTLSVVSSAAFSDQQDLRALLDGVKEIGKPGVPGTISVFGSDAFTVVQDKQKNGTGSPLVAAARFGKGRAVVFGHGGYFTPQTLGVADTGRLMLNAAYWAARRTNKQSQPLRVGVYGKQKIAPFLKSKGFNAPNVTLEQLRSTDVLFANVGQTSKQEQEKIRAFVKGGKGLVTYGIGWGWLQLNKGKTLRIDYPVNQLLAPMGLACADTMTRSTSKRGYATDKPPSPLTHAGKALEALAARSGKGRRKPKKQDAAQIGVTLSLAIRSIPPEDEILLPKLRSLMEKESASAFPTKKQPFREGDVLKRLLLTERIREAKKLPPEKVEAHPAAAEFPGAVPADAPRVTRTIEIDTHVPRWHSTGLYAAPGELIKVQAPRAAARKKLKVRVGALKDRTWHKPVWQRVPELIRELDIKSVSTSAASAFGGGIYIIVPRGCKLGTISVTITGAVEAPYYVLGQTDLKEWRETIRRRPAPWAELATSKIILTTQSKYVRELDDPESLMKLWDRVMDACADLATIPRERQSAERIVLDRQISAGGLHAGYPIMGHLRWSAEALVSREKILQGTWGFFHEIGHNHQNRDWTFSGTGEVTVNLFSLYIQETICGIRNCDDRRIGTEARKKRIDEFLKTGQKKPFVFLVMYVQMQEAFGWDAFKKVFAEYRALPEGERPKTDDEKRDQWLVRFSKTAGRNLGPFFEWWEVATSKKARDSISHLPIWMPEGLPPKTD